MKRSFFTFEQIAYLVDAYQGRTQPYSFFSYALFVTFFPQFIAGPIVHHSEIIPQLQKPETFQLKYENLNIGLTIFVIGLFKKVVLADSIAVYATSIFNYAQEGHTLSFYTAWQGALSYTFQIYFDFSGYSDMAIGLGRMFNIRIPANFNSPYKALSIIDFWRRWHMTLSRFLRDYLYIALGGNRKGRIRRHVNLLLTMLIGGLWHGASWNFIIWGGLHGVYLVINHMLRHILWPRMSNKTWQWLYRRLAHLLTFTAVVFAWVYFRAETFFAANNMIQAMLGLNDLRPSAQSDYSFWALIAFLFFVAWGTPNTQSFIREASTNQTQSPKARWVLHWKPNLGYLLLFSALTYFTLAEIPGKISEFIYYQF